MKLTALLILMASTQISAKVFSQDAKISLHLKDARLSKLFKAIEKRTDLRFVYSNNILPPGRIVNLNVKDQPVSEILMAALSATTLTYSSLKNKLVVISLKDPVAQFKTITGTVTDDKGNPLIGVTVKVTGSPAATTTDTAGNYSIEVTGNEKLEFSYVGYNSQTVTTTGRTVINVVMIANVSSLSDVVVVGYGTQKKVNLTGAVSSIQGSDVVTTKNENVQNMLTGKIPGVRVTQKTAEPGLSCPKIGLHKLSVKCIIQMNL